MEPYAVYLLRRFNAGESVEQLAATEGIPRDRILMRLSAALHYQGNQKERSRAALRDVPAEAAN